MITFIDIQAFKRFRQEGFELAPLTILAGLNGSGKTSLVHAILLAWEASVGASGNAVHLNGPFGLELGTAEDIRNWRTDTEITITIQSDRSPNATWRFGVPHDDALYVRVEEKPEAPPAAFSGAARSFAYLSAERLGPRSNLDASPRPASDLEVGVRGQFSAQILEALGDKPIDDAARSHPERDESIPALLKYEVERWLSEITKPIEIDAIRYSGSTVFSLRFRSIGGEWVRATNMGFGLSYALPIIVAGLTAKPDGLLLVENPEAHLHPAGQSRMGAFLGWLASRGVQVVVETHSDHVLNGVRRAIGEHKYLSASQAVVQFFGNGESDDQAARKLSFTSVGGMSNWPQGFFDQYQTDVASLGRVRRGARQ